MKCLKFWQESAQPKVLGEDARLAQSLSFAEREDPPFSEVNVLLDVFVLEIGRDVRFEFLTELVHPVEFRPLFGKLPANAIAGGWEDREAMRGAFRQKY